MSEHSCNCEFGCVAWVMLVILTLNSCESQQYIREAANGVRELRKDLRHESRMTRDTLRAAK